MRRPERLWNFWVAAFLLRLVIVAIPGGNPYDQACFKAWGLDMLRHGPAGFYAASGDLIPCDYPPLSLYVLWVWAWLAHLVDPGIVTWTREQVFAMSPLNAWFKLPGGLADLLNGWLLMRVLLPLVGEDRARGAAKLYLFNPLFLYDSVYWGQMDALLLSVMLACLLALRGGQLLRASVLGTLALLLKPQGLFLAPFALLTQLGRGHGWRWLLAPLLALGVATLVVRPFWPDEPLVSALAPLVHLMQGTANGYPFGSLHAFNLHALTGGEGQPDSGMFLGLTRQVWGLLLVGLVQGLLALRLVRPLSDARFHLGAFLSVGAWFCFATRMHERYFIPALGLFTIAVVLDPRWRRLYALLCLVSVLNLLVAQDPNVARTFEAVQLTWILSLVNLVGFLWVAVAFVGSGSSSLLPAPPGPEATEPVETSGRTA